MKVSVQLMTARVDGAFYLVFETFLSKLAQCAPRPHTYDCCMMITIAFKYSYTQIVSTISIQASTAHLLERLASDRKVVGSISGFGNFFK